jgi:hypothetical protein
MTRSPSLSKQPHLGLHQTALVVAAPFLLDRAAQLLGRSQDVVSCSGSCPALGPRFGIPAGQDDGCCVSGGNGFVTGLGVIGTVGTEQTKHLVFWDLGEQLRQHQRIPDGVVGDFDGLDLQSVCIHA